jgi:uncharacterized protein YciI
MSRKFFAASSLVVLLLVLLVGAAFARQHAQEPPVATARWLVLFEVGPKFDATKLLRDQPGFMEHVAVLKKLEESGALLVGGPLLESFESHKATGAAWIVEAPTAEAARKLVLSDPFVSGDLSKIQSIRAFFAGSGAWIPKAGDAKGGPKPNEKPAGGDAKQH